MKLAVAGKEDVDTLERWIKERFERVPVRTEGFPPVGTEGLRIAFEDNPIGPSQQAVRHPHSRELTCRCSRLPNLSETNEG